MPGALAWLMYLPQMLYEVGLLPVPVLQGKKLRLRAGKQPASSYRASGAGAGPGTQAWGGAGVLP